MLQITLIKGMSINTLCLSLLVYESLIQDWKEEDYRVVVNYRN